MASRPARPPSSKSWRGGCIAAAAARAWSSGVRRAPPTRRAATAARTTGRGRWPASATRRARVVIVGLAPAAHGANRTGRMFTGDRSGDWLFAALHRAGFANQPESERPRRRPAAARRLRDRRRALRAAGQQADHRPSATTACPTSSASWSCWSEAGCSSRSAASPGTAALRAARALGERGAAARSRASATAPRRSSGRWTLLGCYHPSQQNTFTGRLTEPMIDAVFQRARDLAPG